MPYHDAAVAVEEGTSHSDQSVIATRRRNWMRGALLVYGKERSHKRGTWGTSCSVHGLPASSDSRRMVLERTASPAGVARIQQQLMKYVAPFLYKDAMKIVWSTHSRNDVMAPMRLVEEVWCIVGNVRTCTLRQYENLKKATAVEPTWKPKESDCSATRVGQWLIEVAIVQCSWWWHYTWNGMCSINNSVGSVITSFLIDMYSPRIRL